MKISVSARIRMTLVAAAVTLAPASNLAAQPSAWRFRWQPGQVLTYKVEQTTSASEVIDGKSTETSTKLNNVKRWQVLEVDAAGTATMQMSLAALRLETTTPAGETMHFDSADPEKSTPQMREQLAKYVGNPLIVVRVDASGKVVEVKDCKFGSPSRLESEPPFGVILPNARRQRRRLDSELPNYLGASTRHR